jgi:mono/diheme cytochrome c family protein
VTVTLDVAVGQFDEEGRERMRNAGRETGGLRRSALLMLVGLGVLASLALTLNACGSSSDNSSETTASTESQAADTGSQAAEAGAQVFASANCGSCHTFKAADSKGTVGPNLNEYLEPDDNKAGIEEMIVDPNAEIAEGYSANVMPDNFGDVLDSEEVKQLVDFLYENSPASEGQKGEQGEEEEGK